MRSFFYTPIADLAQVSHHRCVSLAGHRGATTALQAAAAAPRRGGRALILAASRGTTSATTTGLSALLAGAGWGGAGRLGGRAGGRAVVRGRRALGVGTRPRPRGGGRRGAARGAERGRVRCSRQGGRTLAGRTGRQTSHAAASSRRPARRGVSAFSHSANGRPGSQSSSVRSPLPSQEDFAFVAKLHAPRPRRPDSLRTVAARHCQAQPPSPSRPVCVEPRSTSRWTPRPWTPPACTSSRTILRRLAPLSRTPLSMCPWPSSDVAEAVRATMTPPQLDPTGLY